jgi:hypothetical protein
MYTTAEVQSKIAGMYPEIGKHRLTLSLDFNEAQQAYILTIRRGEEKLTTRLEKHDADECMNGVKCVYLGVQVAQFINNFEERKSFSGRVA